MGLGQKAIEQSLINRNKHRRREKSYIELCVLSVSVMMWEGPYYREPSTAMVKAPEPSPSGLRPELAIRTLAPMPQAGPPIFTEPGLGTGPPIFWLARGHATKSRLLRDTPL